MSFILFILSFFFEKSLFSLNSKTDELINKAHRSLEIRTISVDLKNQIKSFNTNTEVKGFNVNTEFNNFKEDKDIEGFKEDKDKTLENNKDIENAEVIKESNKVIISGEVIISEDSKRKASKNKKDISSAKIIRADIRRNTPYFRLGGGASFGNTIQIVEDNFIAIKLLNFGGRPIYHIGVDDPQVSPTINLAFGYSYYAFNGFMFGFELSTDVNFGNSNSVSAGSANNMIKTTLSDSIVHDVIFEAKAKLGFSIPVEVLRFSGYFLIGFATHTGEYEKGRDYLYTGSLPNNPIETVVSTLFGITWGAGISLNSIRYPIGWYAEFSVPTLFNLITLPLSEILPPPVDFDTDALVIGFMPRFATGIHIGF